MKKVKMLLLMSVVFAFALVAFVGCGFSPSTGHSGRIAGGFTVLDFDVEFRTYDQFVEVDNAWDEAFVPGNVLETNRARAALPCRNSAMFGMPTPSATRVPTEARAFVSLDSLYGETQWTSSNVTGSNHEIAVGQGFYIQQLVAHPASSIEGASGVFARHFTHTQMFDWFTLSYPHEGIPPTNWTTIGSNLAIALGDRWNAVRANEANLTPRSLEELLRDRAANREVMMRVMNQHILHPSMRAMGYEFINTNPVESTSNPFNMFTIVDSAPDSENENLVFVHNIIPTTHSIRLSRHMRFTARSIRTYQNEGRIDENATERVVHKSLAANGIDHITSGAFYVLEGEYSYEGLVYALHPIIPETTRRAVQMTSILETTMTSTYIDGQVRTVTFQIRGQNTEGATAPLIETTSMTFLIDRPH